MIQVIPPLAIKASLGKLQIAFPRYVNTQIITTLQTSSRSSPEITYRVVKYSIQQHSQQHLRQHIKIVTLISIQCLILVNMWTEVSITTPEIGSNQS